MQGRARASTHTTSYQLWRLHWTYHRDHVSDTITRVNDGTGERATHSLQGATCSTQEAHLSERLTDASKTWACTITCKHKQTNTTRTRRTGTHTHLLGRP